MTETVFLATTLVTSKRLSKRGGDSAGQVRCSSGFSFIDLQDEVCRDYEVLVTSDSDEVLEENGTI